MAAVIAVLAALTLAAPGYGATAGSAARVRSCAYTRSADGFVVEAVIRGRGVTPLFCRIFNLSFKGRHVHGRYGKIRCLFANYRLHIYIAIRTRNRTVGRFACLGAKPGLRRSGYHELLGP